MYNFEKFKSDILLNKNERIVIDKAYDIIKITKYLRSTTIQRKLEKLFNIFQLSKEEVKFNLNPQWRNQISFLFQHEKLLFKSHYVSILNLINMKFMRFNINVFDPIFFTYEECFNLILYKYILNYNNFNFSEAENMILTTTFLNSFTIFFIYSYNDFIKYLLVKHFIVVTQRNIEIYNLIINKKVKVFSFSNLLLFYLQLNFSDESINKKNPKFISLLSEFDTFYNALNSDIFSLFSDYCKYALDTCFELQIFKRTVGFYMKKKYDYISFFHIEKFSIISKFGYFLHQIPMICKPKDWNILGNLGGYLLNNKNITPLSSKLSEGFSIFKYSKLFIKIINLIQQKKYVLNWFILDYIKSDLFLNDVEILSESNLYDLYLQIANLSKEINTFYISICTEKFNNYLLQKENLYKDLQQNIITNSVFSNQLLLLKQKYAIPEDYEYKYKKFLKLNKKYNAELLKFGNHQFYTNIFYLFNELRIISYSYPYNIYFPVTIDFRGRIYPAGRGPHRASGLYKIFFSTDEYFNYNEIARKELIYYICSQYTKQNLVSKNELYNWFLNEIDIFDTKEILDFLHIIINSSDNMDIFESYKYESFHNFDFKITPIDLIKQSKNTTLFILGLLEYFTLKKNTNNFLDYTLYSSNYLIDFDQTCSGPMIYSLLSGDKFIAKHTNLILGYDILETTTVPKCYDLYTEFSNYLYNEFTCNQQLKESLNSFYLHYDKIFDRKFFKLLVMPTFYFMQKKGIMKLLKKTLSSQTFIQFTYDDIVVFCNFIQNKLKLFFNNSLRFQHLLVDIAKLFFKFKYPLKMLTLDGSYIEYKYLNVNIAYRRIKQLNSKKYLTYKIYLPLSNSDNILHAKHYTTFPPNFIHMLDASLCRLIIYVYYKLFGIVIESLHDCFRIHPTLVNSLSKVIKYVYIFYFFPNFVRKYKLSLKVVNKSLFSLEFCYGENYPFPYLEILNVDILDHCFLSLIYFDKDFMEKYVVLKKKFDAYEKFSDNEIFSILSNDFMFFY